MRALTAAAFTGLLVACGPSGSVSYTTNPAGSSAGSTSSGGTLASSSSGGAGTSNTSSSGAGTTNGGGGSSSTGGSLCSTQQCVVYASSNTDLYQVNPADPATAPTHLCAFGGALSSSDTVTDIAVISQGTLYAITETDLYTVNPTTCVATLVHSLSTSNEKFVGLAFTYTGTLVGADEKGNVYTIVPTSGVVTKVGTFGNSLACSGDLVAISASTELTDGAIYATAIPLSGSGNDQLVSLDPTTFSSTVIGDTGFQQIYGLGYWGAQLYGFTHAGQVVQIDPTTGHGTVISTTSPSATFSGGATTPLAPQTTHWQ